MLLTRNIFCGHNIALPAEECICITCSASFSVVLLLKLVLLNRLFRVLHQLMQMFGLPLPHLLDLQLNLTSVSGPLSYIDSNLISFCMSCLIYLFMFCLISYFSIALAFWDILSCASLFILLSHLVLSSFVLSNLILKRWFIYCKFQWWQEATQ